MSKRKIENLSKLDTEYDGMTIDVVEKKSEKKERKDLCEEINLIPKDGKDKYKAKTKDMVCCTFISDMMEMDNDLEIPEIPLNYDGETLLLLIEYCQKHTANPSLKPISRPLKQELKDEVLSWEFEFIDKMKFDTVSKLLEAAMYMHMNNLIQLCSAKIASMMKGKKTAEIREIFHIENDFTQDEENKIREENKWCSD